MYAFERIDRRLQLPCDDGSYIIVLNTKCPQEKVPLELQGLFHYINTEEVDEGDWFVEMIHQMVLRYQSDEEVAYMATLEDEYLRKCTSAERRGLAEGRAKGLAEGRAEGRMEERERMNKLLVLLAEQGRTDEAVKAATDEALQDRLLAEFNI